MTDNKLFQCSRCVKFKTYDLFTKDKKRKNGIGSRCKQCINELNKIYRKNNKEDYLEKRKLYYQKNAQKFRIQRYINNFTEFNHKHNIKNHITIEDINSMKIKQNNKCEFCGIEMCLDCKDVAPNLLVIYRKIYDLGYVKDNFVLSCYQCYIPKQKLKWHQ